MPEARDGCTCARCERRYVVDLNIPDALWCLIHAQSPAPDRMLCGECIMELIEGLGNFAAYELRPL